MTGVGMAKAEPREKPAIDDVLVTPVHEGGTDDWSRFEGASAAIGYFLRLVHEGRMSMDEGSTAICGYKAAIRGARKRRRDRIRRPERVMR